MSALLEVEDARKRFGGVVAVDGCSFQVQAGTITGLIGPNGSGKTTVFNLITGYLPADSGRISFGGAPVPRPDPTRLARLGLIRTFQQARVFANLTVLENLALAVPTRRLGALRARVSAVGENLFHSRVAIFAETDGSHGKIGSFKVSIDDGVVYTAPGAFHADDLTPIYEHSVAPGRHSITVDLTRKDDRNEAFRNDQKTRFVVDVPRDDELTVEIEVDDYSGMGDDFPSGKSGKDLVDSTHPVDPHTLDLILKADYVHARDTISGDPLPRIPPFHGSVVPADLADAKNRISATGKSRSSSRRRMTAPTCPVAPTTPTRRPVRSLMTTVPSRRRPRPRRPCCPG